MLSCLMELQMYILVVNFWKLTIQRFQLCVELNTPYLYFLNYVTIIPVVKQMITAHKEIYKLSGSSIYHKPHSIFKPKYYEFNNRNIGLFSVNDTRMDGYFIGIHIYMPMRKSLLALSYSPEFNTMALK